MLKEGAVHTNLASKKVKRDVCADLETCLALLSLYLASLFTKNKDIYLECIHYVDQLNPLVPDVH